MEQKQDFFVDEAGDTTLFGRHGKLLVGTEVVSRFFIVGRLEVMDLPALEADVAAVRQQLMADPLLQAVPSMQANAGKTALFFHAKDDVPEVRHAVFSLLLRHELHFTAVVKDKLALLTAVQRNMAADAAYRYKPDGHEVYDQLTDALFARFGQFGAQRHITFAVRGAKPRTHALQQLLDKIDADFIRDFGFAPHGQTKIHSGYPAQSAGLQACDYLLWALQRFYERGEERYLKAMWPKFGRVIDLESGEFHEKHPLTLENRAGVGIRVPGDIG
jgi:Protein of unknown function (DUF3800)